MVCGGGPVIAGAMDIVRQLAETLNMVVATTVSGQGVIAETHPNALGVVGSNGGVPVTRVVMDKADLVLFVGCRAGSVTTERWRSPGKSVPVIHIDSDRWYWARIIEPKLRYVQMPIWGCLPCWAQSGAKTDN